MPIWDLKPYGPYGNKIIDTTFGQPEQLKALTEIFADQPDILQQLTEAAKNGTPILLKQEGAAGQWQDATNEKFFQNILSSVENIKKGINEAAQTASNSDVVAEGVEQSTGFLKSLYDDGKLTDKGKIAAVFGLLTTVAIGYGIYSWCNREKPDSKVETPTIEISQNKNELKQPARTHYVLWS